MVRKMEKYKKQSKAYYRGCLLGCAIGDAMTYPKKQMSPAALRDLLGEDGFQELVTNDSVEKSLVSNDTQLAAFTADGLIWADSRAKETAAYAVLLVLGLAYLAAFALRWQVW